MNVLYRGLLTLEACSWMLIVFVVKDKTTLCGMAPLLLAFIIAVLTVLMALLSIKLSNRLGSESDIEGCRECELADGSFLPVYLGYFFVSLSVSDWSVMLVVVSIVFVFTYLSQTQVFNPLFLLFGYHYYHIVTKDGSAIFVIARGSVLRNADAIHISNLRRINNMTYIERN